ncbi:MAG: type II secretion system F family protein [Candidatus Omnitrophota bacterium]|nr:type II secretion system F family protein [Candidatus Omnitrophota bacterium]
MARFVYEAKTSPKETIRGALVADSRSAAIQKISQMGYYLLSLDEETEALNRSQARHRSLFPEKISIKDITDFTRQLSDLLEAGITIAKALDILHDQTQNKRLKKIILDIRDFCVSGNPLSDALARHPKVFSNLYVSMVRSGETGGMLDNILRRLSDFNEKQLDIQTKIRTALAYPLLMTVVGFTTIIILVTFVMPKMTVMFSDFGQALPLPTLILLGISGIIQHYWLILILFIAGITMTIMKIYNTPQGKFAIDSFKLNSPLLGPLVKKVEIARFTRTLATLLENGVPILGALQIVLETVGNAVIKGEIEKAAVAVKEGSSLAEGLGGSRSIPPAVMNMIAIGEEGGHVEKSLLKVALGYERESDEAIKIMMSLIEPLLILTLGIVVGFIVISMLLPIFEMNFLVR